MKNEIKRLSSLLLEVNGKVIVNFDARNDSDLDLFREIHGTDILPDDFRYSMISRLLDRLQEYDFESVDDLRNRGLDHEIIDSLVDVYTGHLTDWLASHNCRVDFCNEATEEGLTSGSDIINTIQCGQYKEIEMIMNNILSYLENLNNELTEAV